MRIAGAQHPGKLNIKRTGRSSSFPILSLKPDLIIKSARTKKGNSDGIITDEQIASPLLIPVETALGHASKSQPAVVQAAKRVKVVIVDFFKTLTNIYLFLSRGTKPFVYFSVAGRIFMSAIAYFVVGVFETAKKAAY